MSEVMHAPESPSVESGDQPELWFYHHNEKDKPWTVAPEDDRPRILMEVRPRYMTVLATSIRAAFGEVISREAQNSARYKGPLYFDWDSEDDLQFAITKVNQFLDQAGQLGVDLRSIRLFCSGSRGFHAEIAAETFMKVVPPEGVVNLPEIYKEMMFALYVDTLDTNVYSKRRGRMWRVPNIERENHKYKVAVTLEEMRAMTPEEYETLVSAPRPVPVWNAPTYCPSLAVIYLKAVATVAGGRSHKRKSSQSTSRSPGGTPDADPANAAVRFIQSVAEAALNHIDALLPRLLPDGIWEGGNYVSRNPMRDDRNPGSFKVHVDGFWKDWAEETHKGGDLVALKRFLDGNTYSMLEAARRLAAEIGFPILDTDNQPTAPSSVSGQLSAPTSVSGQLSAPTSVSGSTTREPIITNVMDLLARDFPPVRWVVEGVLPEGLSLLAGSPKTGKSWMVLEIALAVASGSTCLGGRTTLRGRALYLALEDNQRRLKDRIGLILQAGKLGLPEQMDFAIEWPRLDQGGVEKLASWLSQHPDARLVVIDTLARMRGKQSSNANLYAEDNAVGAELKQLSDKYRVAVVLVTHVRKAESKDPLEMVTGTFGVVAGMDGVLVLKRERGQGTASLYVTGRDVPEDRYYALTWNKDTCRWTIEGDAKEVQMSEARREIVALLAQQKRPLSAKEIAAELSRKHDATRRLLPDMVRDGLIHETKDGPRWLYTHPAYSAAATTLPSSHPGSTPPVPPTPPTGGSALRRPPAAGTAMDALGDSAGVGVTGGAPARVGNGGSNVSLGSGGNSGSSAQEFPKSFEVPGVWPSDVPPAQIERITRRGAAE